MNVLTCASCHEENADNARFCHACGTALSPSDAERFRRTVTILFTDVVGSTALADRLDPESVADLMTTYYDVARSVLERHGGWVAKFVGDAVMAVFGLPRVHEDDALRAVRAALDLREALVDLNLELDRRWGVTITTRTGINTGPVASAGLVPDQDFVGGDTANVAARIQQQAQSGEILLSQATHRLVRHAVVTEELAPVGLKGKATPAALLRLVAATPGGQALERGLTTTLVGRRDELALLRESWRRVLAEPHTRLVTVIGDAGVGKSRLVREFVHQLGDEAVVLDCRCLSYGEGITYLPVVEAVTQAAGILPRDSSAEARRKLDELLVGTPDGDVVAERIAQLMGISENPAAREEIFWAVRRVLDTVAQRRPLLLVVDDVHWAEPTMLDLIEHLVSASSEAPVLLLCMARPELLELRAGWESEGAARPSIVLAPLTGAESTELIDSLLGGADLRADLRERIAEAAAGNPLFVEQMLSMLIDDGLLRREDGGWVAAGDLSELQVPSSIQALLAARLERLEPDERRAIGFAAVVAKDFHVSDVEALSPEPLRPRIGGLLAGLARKQLLREQPPSEADGAFTFCHALIRSVTYELLAKSSRAELHERYADWLESGAPGRVSELVEVVAHHLERAYGYRAQLGRVDGRVRSIALRAANRLAEASSRALARGDMPATAGLVSRAVALMDPSDGRRPRLLVDLGEALHWSGRFDEARAALVDALQAAGEAGDVRAEVNARVELAWLPLRVDPSAPFAALVEECDRAIAVLEPLGDDVGAARAWRLVTWAHGTLGHFADAETAARRAVAHADRAGDPRAAYDRATLTACFFYGPAPATEGVAQALDLLAEVRGHPAAEAQLLLRLGMLEAVRGRLDEAERRIGAGQALIEELGPHLVSLETSALALGYLRMIQDDWPAAEHEFRAVCEALEGLGETGFTSSSAARLAWCLCQQGRNEEAETVTRMSERSASSDDVFSQVLWRAARATAKAGQGQLDEGESLAREAVRRVSETDMPELTGDAFMALATVLARANRSAEAVSAADEALRQYERKGHLIAAARARRARAGMLAAV